MKDEVRANFLKAIKANEPLFPGIVGYDSTVLPEISLALLAGHDILFLGEKGQAKSRLMRSLVRFLDEEIPYLEYPGLQVHENPYQPITSPGKRLVAETPASEVPIGWWRREDRYAERLAPGTKFADVLGEIDPSKLVAGVSLSAEEAISFGLIPRMHRGIFAMNEIPELDELVQVGLFNILEERDVQIRGFKVRLPLDVMLFASANPEDYTNRGRIITPLKDRFGAQIRTHYPLDAATELTIVEQEVELPDDIAVSVPEFMGEIIATFSQLARASSHVNQRSGVSVRLSVANYETLVANAMRRSLRTNERLVVPRVSDLDALASSTTGKIEFETLGDGRESEILEHLVRAAVLTVFKDSVPPITHRAVIEAFDNGVSASAGEDISSADYLALLKSMPALDAPVQALLADEPDAEAPEVVASAIEFVLEGLHLSKRLNKDAAGGRAQYRSRG